MAERPSIRFGPNTMSSGDGTSTYTKARWRAVKNVVPLVKVRKARSVRAIVRDIKNMKRKQRAQEELQWHDVTVSESPDTSENYLHLSAIPQGDTAVQRDGNKVYVTGLDFHLLLSKADTYNVVRIVFLIDKGGIALTPNQYLETVSNPMSFRSGEDNVGRFKVLYDKTYLVDETHPNKLISGHLKVNKVINYISSATGIPSRNGLWMMTISDSGVATHPSITGYTRLRFLDN